MDKTILVVDDDPAICEVIQEMLAVYHYHVLVAHDGIEAVEETNRHHIDLILMDIRLPYFSGLWFCEAFRHKKNTSNIPVVIVSGFLDEDSVKRARLAGAVDAVSKPFTSRDLLETVRKNVL